MRLGIAAAACLAAFPCLAASLPTAGDYGSDAGCAAAPPFTADAGALQLRLTPTAMHGLEWACTFDRVTKRGAAYEVAASCSSEGETRHVTVTVAEHPDGTLTYTDDSGAVVLHRCR